jgi:hypothetical protein
MRVTVCLEKKEVAGEEKNERSAVDQHEKEEKAEGRGLCLVLQVNFGGSVEFSLWLREKNRRIFALAYLNTCIKPLMGPRQIGQFRNCCPQGPHKH